MREALLVRHFLWRFLEHDLISTKTDRHVTLSVFAGTLLALSLFITMLIGLAYQLAPHMPAGLVSLSSLDDRFTLMSMAMLVSGLVAVAQWDALMLDTRDVAVLGVLPIPRRMLVRAKLAATALLAGAVVIACNGFPTLFRGLAVPTGLHVGWGGTVQLTLAQGLVGSASALFGFLFVLGVRESAAAILGPSRFQRVSAPLQAGLVVTLVCALLLMPAYRYQIGSRWVASSRTTTSLSPPLWFIALHETVAGTVIDRLPHGTTQRFLVGREERATALYRRLWPEYHALAPIAVIAMLAAITVTAAGCLWNSRRLPVAMARVVRHGAVASLWRRLVGLSVARTALQRAGFFFTLQTLSRHAAHRMVMAMAGAVSLACIIIAANRQSPLVVAASSIPVTMLATQYLVLASALIGFRHAVRLPAGLAASSTFVLASPMDVAPYLAGVKRAGAVAVILPSIVLLTGLSVALMGLRLALLHAVMGLVVGVVTLEGLFFRADRVPLVSAYEPTSDPKVRWSAYIACALQGAFLVAALERWALADAVRYASVVVTATLVVVASQWFGPASTMSPAALDTDAPSSFASSVLNLSE